MNEVRRIVSEVYSPPRVTSMANKHPSLGFSAGFALDLTTADETVYHGTSA
jgi:hypothetical protein